MNIAISASTACEQKYSMSSVAAQKLWPTYWDERDGLSTLMDKINQRAEMAGYEPINALALDPENRDRWWFESNEVSNREKNAFYDVEMKKEARKLITSTHFDEFFQERKLYLDRINEMTANFEDYDFDVQDVFKAQFLRPGDRFTTAWIHAEHPSRLTNRVLAQRWEQVERAIKRSREQTNAKTELNSNSLVFADCFDATRWNFTK